MATSNVPPTQPYQNTPGLSFPFWGKPVLQDTNGQLYCPGFDGPPYASNEWDIVRIDWPLIFPIASYGVKGTPGVAEVTVGKRHAVDKKKSAGKDGARITFHGVYVADIEIRLTLWTPEQLRIFNQIMEQIFPKGLSAANIYSVNHPAFTGAGIRELMFTGFDGPTTGSAVRSKVFTLHALEFIPQKSTSPKATKTPVADLKSVFDTPVLPTPDKNPAAVGP